MDRSEILYKVYHGKLDNVSINMFQVMLCRTLNSCRKLTGEVICLTGPPGVGKKSIRRSLARTLTRIFLSCQWQDYLILLKLR